MKRIYILLSFIFFSSISYAQLVYEPIQNNVYDFLERQHIKGNISLTSEVKPFSRKYIAEKISELAAKEYLLNSVENENLKWYKKEYSYELNNEEKRLRLFSHSDSLFQFNISPIGGYEISGTGDKSGHSRWVGARFFGTFDTWFGADLELRDNGEFGDNIDKQKIISPKTGHEYIDVPNGIEFSDIKGSMNFNWKWGSVSIAKDYMNWGYGRFGQQILSSKAPSFPYIKFEMQPADWFRFYYYHGWINSQVIDSSKTIKANNSPLSSFYSEEFVPKYVVANMFAFTPFEWMDVFLGNSFVYSGNLRLEMFIPFNFYKYMDRETGKISVDDGNGQLYLGFNNRYFKNTEFYFTIFFDVIEVRKLLENDKNDNNWYGLTIGGKHTDLIFDNLDITFEYSKVNPWVYEHKDLTTTYKHLNYDLGHWIGQNADEMRIQLDYMPLRGLLINAYYERLRKGGLLDIYYGYEDKISEEFLYGPVRKDNKFGIEVSYEFIHELFIQGKYSYTDITDEQPGRTPDFLLGKKNNFSLALYYGIR